MTAARWVRVRPTRSMVPDGVRRGSAPAVTCGNAWSHGAYPLLCKQGVVGSSPISSTTHTTARFRDTRRWEPGARCFAFGARLRRTAQRGTAWPNGVQVWPSHVNTRGLTGDAPVVNHSWTPTAITRSSSDTSPGGPARHASST